MSNSIRVPNYYDGVTPLYLSRWSSDFGASQEDSLHQSGYLRVDDDVSTQFLVDGAGHGYFNTEWLTFPVLDEFDDSDMVLEGAKIPITVTIIDDEANEVDHEMGSGVTSVPLNPPEGRQFVAARVKRRL